MADGNQSKGDSDSVRNFMRLASTDDDFNITTSNRSKRCLPTCFRTNVEKILTVIVFVLLVISVISLTLLALEKKSGCKSCPGSSINDSEEQKVCLFSDEAKRIGLKEFLEKVQTIYYKYNRDTFDVFPRPLGFSYVTYFKERYLPTNITPIYLKEKTDAALSLYEEIKNEDIDENKMKAREIKAVHQVKLFLRSVFGVPYDTNFYDGDWLLGPNHFCWQPICLLGSRITKYSLYAKPDNLSELEVVLDKLKLHGETIRQFKLNMQLGVKVGMVRSIFVCRSGVNALKQAFKRIAKQNNAKDVLREWFVEGLRNKTFLDRMSKSDQETWTNNKGKNISESIDEAVIEGIGRPLVELLDYLENEHIKHCLPLDVSSGLANLPVEYIYENGNRTNIRTTKRLPITGELLNGKKTYKNMLPYFTTSFITPGEINKIGQDRLKVLYPQVVQIAKNLTGKSKEEEAIKEFKKILDSPKQNFNAKPFPANESDEAAYRNCSDKDLAKKNCPERWTAMENWSRDCRQTMAMIAPKLIPLFYHTGTKITIPNCPVEMVPNFNPSAAAQTFRPSDSSCRISTLYSMPFFLDNFGPRYSEWTITAHEAWPGHHTQLQAQIEYFQDNCGDVLKWLESKSRCTFFTEGWGLYAENPVVAKDTNIYDEKPLQKYGMLRWQVWRALRLIVDTGLHYRGMNRTTAMKLFSKYAWDESDLAEKEVTRYQGTAGQATAYMLGQQKLIQLREYCESKLGKKFKIKDFHYQVLSQGKAPESYLDRHIKKYVSCALRKLHEESSSCKNILQPRPKRTRRSEEDIFEERPWEHYYV